MSTSAPPLTAIQRAMREEEARIEARESQQPEMVDLGPDDGEDDMLARRFSRDASPTGSERFEQMTNEELVEFRNTFNREIEETQRR